MGRNCSHFVIIMNSLHFNPIEGDSFSNTVKFNYATHPHTFIMLIHHVMAELSLYYIIQESVMNVKITRRIIITVK